MRILKQIFLMIWLIVPVYAYAQKPPKLPHGMVFGKKPGGIAPGDATKIEVDMQKKIRVTTAIRGKILRVTKSKGGWFEMDAGNGKVITAHFNDYKINLPTALKGRTVIIQGVADKQFIADDLQHFAGDTVVGKRQHRVKVDPKRRMIFEVDGMVIDQ